MSPLKLYEYLAGGRPVAASDLAPVRDVDPRVVLVPEGHSFADGVDEALSRGPLTEDDRFAFIEANSWARRHEQILRVACSATRGVKEQCQDEPSSLTASVRATEVAGPDDH